MPKASTRMADADVQTNLSRAVDAFMREDADYDESAGLIHAFASHAAKDVGHRRAVWLCCLAVSRMLPHSVVMPGTNRTLGMLVSEIHTWMLDGTEPDDIATICTPDTELLPQRDCEWSDRESIDAISSLARFALHGGVPDGVDVLDHAFVYDELRTYNQPNAMPFGLRLRDIAIPAAYSLTHLRPEQMLPPARQTDDGA